MVGTASGEMPYVVEFEKQTGVIVVTWRDELTGAAFREYYDALGSHPELRPGMNRLYDFRAADLALSTSNIGAARDAISRRDAVHGRRKTAILIVDDHGFGLMRVYMAKSDQQVASDILVTRSSGEAMAWVGLPEGYVLPSER
ncbi:MAG: hypothetical protein QF578_10845 [Alphaproteobacteria bacterium]|nr:hypothetical protein [Alphaproteobacteria bacterium]MDP6565313.1 hypothetical protein [Alphaproteobacteria bacterium]MDP6812054.1 hypothetical protein [Alphaproteobacteria bacterium]